MKTICYFKLTQYEKNSSTQYHHSPRANIRAVQHTTRRGHLVIVFHFLILLKIIPFKIAWGGRLESEQEMYVFESISIALNLFLILIVLLKSKNIKNKLVDFMLWVFFGIFSLNTIGNLFAYTSFEKYFSILAFIFALLIWGIIKK